MTEILKEFERLMDSSSEEIRQHFDALANGIHDHVRLAVAAASDSVDKVDRLAGTMRNEFAEIRTLIAP